MFVRVYVKKQSEKAINKDKERKKEHRRKDGTGASTEDERHGQGGNVGGGYTIQVAAPAVEEATVIRAQGGLERALEQASVQDKSQLRGLDYQKQITVKKKFKNQFNVGFSLKFLIFRSQLFRQRVFEKVFFFYELYETNNSAV
ncbi:hypothetical protein RFI_37327 [Reticulomyxa filosa]|uniref:Uncharacterized protein n=1 Tax=Reticulomyxa filosa TaxID=46433 RepID=X6LDQ2_RETFI|nr:hypothetical protein RFI_37327 [Reticulomyxa filosa]|eukprot:ETO00133.1 hypothetical protein RFI_37327 [Reticulomyxa filosa]